MLSTQNNKMLIGITGPFGSGKTTASEFLQDKGYKRFSFSDVIKEIAVGRGLPTNDRKVLQDIGDELRKSEGLDILAKKTLERAKKSGSNLIIIDGIRNLGELEYARKQGGFVIGVTSSSDLRFKRLSRKGKYYYGKTRHEFDRDEARDRGIGQKTYGQHADECVKASDLIIVNNGSIEELKREILEVIK